ncbi:hypothetical protein [Notoacmeibacter ruber]|uniref:hypothetical protein n=1 Tax=Notoacmeibacter ruber TaxID=2670375 RepID=UPI0011C497A9|nr:hypothetical protein [Notoacmeibacter ruber]
MWLTPLQRVYLLYGGSVLVALGLLIYWIFCPTQIREFGDRNSYVRSIVEGLKPEEFRSILENFGSVFPKNEIGDNISGDRIMFGIIGEHDVRKSMSYFHNGRAISQTVANKRRREEAVAAIVANFELLDRQRAGRCFFSFSLLVTGGLIFLIPSIEVFLRVISRMINLQL